MVPFARYVALAIAAVICFAVIVPMAVHRGQTGLAIAISAAFVVYLVANVALMRRYPRR